MYLPTLGVLAADPLRANSPMSMDLVCRGAVGVADNREEELLWNTSDDYCVGLRKERERIWSHLPDSMLSWLVELLEDEELILLGAGEGGGRSPAWNRNQQLFFSDLWPSAWSKHPTVKAPASNPNCCITGESLGRPACSWRAFEVKTKKSFPFFF